MEKDLKILQIMKETLLIINAERNSAVLQQNLSNRDFYISLTIK